jgi:uncharacterized protein YbcI
MDDSQGNIGQKIAQAAHAIEKQRTKHGRKWAAVFLNEDTLAIALHGCLTAAENALAHSPSGATQVRDYHQQLFAGLPASLLQRIKCLTGMEVRDTTAEIHANAGSVVQIFTTNSVGIDFSSFPRPVTSDLKAIRSTGRTAALAAKQGPADS